MTTSVDLPKLEADLTAEIAGSADLAALEAVRVTTVGKKGRVSELMATLGKMPPDQRKAFGQTVNALKTAIAVALDARKAVLETAALSQKLATERADITLPVRRGPMLEGRIHPVSQVFDEIAEIFADMGFAIAEGPDIETDDLNFTKLNIPPEHPARQMHDTFYLKTPNTVAGSNASPMVLRTHTSPVQIRTMMTQKPPIRIIAPEGTIVNARHPAPVAHRMAPSHLMLNVLFGALSQAVPDRIPAAYYGVSYVCSFQTVADDGRRQVLVEIEVGGCGGHPKGDGASAHSFGMHNNASIPVEMIESDMPITFTGYGLLPGTGGDGEHRGGLGLYREWRVDAPTASFTAQMDRFRYRPYGLGGGGYGSAGKLLLIRDGTKTALHSKVGNMALKRGDIIRLETSGGGGHGDPTMRAKDARANDATQGYV